MSDWDIVQTFVFWYTVGLLLAAIVAIGTDR